MPTVLLVLKDARFISFQMAGTDNVAWEAARRRVVELIQDGFHTDHGRNPLVRVFVESPGANPFEFSADDVARWARE